MVEDPPPKGTLGTVRNASLLLDLLSEGAAYQPLSELAERSGLSTPTVHRVLRSLVVAGLVEQDPGSARYGLGPELVRLAERFLGRQPLLRELTPYLVDLRNRSEATLLVALLVRDRVVYVERIDGADDASLHRSGRSFPALQTASGRLLVAHADVETWKRFCRDTHPDVTDLEDWRSSDHLALPVPGMHGHLEVAVPILGPEGTAVAALAATGGPPNLPASVLLDQVLPELLQIAARVGAVGPDGW